MNFGNNFIDFFLYGQINNIPRLVQIMVWRPPGDKPLFEPMLFSLLTIRCVTRAPWDKYDFSPNLDWQGFWIILLFPLKLSSLLSSSFLLSTETFPKPLLSLPYHYHYEILTYWGSPCEAQSAVVLSKSLIRGFVFRPDVPIVQAIAGNFPAPPKRPKYVIYIHMFNWWGMGGLWWWAISGLCFILHLV